MNDSTTSIIPGVQTVLLERLTLDPKLQPRKDMDPDLISEYAERMQAGDQFPALVAYLDADGSGHCWLAQGWHRYGAARQAQVEAHQVEVRLGTWRDALLDSLASNREHGLRRSNADKRRAVIAMLTDAEWARWSDHAIAEHLGVAHVTVARHRDALSGTLFQIDAPEAAPAQQPLPPLTRLVQRGDQQYEMNVTALSRPSTPTFAELLARNGAADDPEIQRTRRAEAFAVFASRWFDGVAAVRDLELTVSESDEADYLEAQRLVESLRAFAARLDQVLSDRRQLRVVDGGQRG